MCAFEPEWNAYQWTDLGSLVGRLTNQSLPVHTTLRNCGHASSGPLLLRSPCPRGSAAVFFHGLHTTLPHTTPTPLEQRGDTKLDANLESSINEVHQHILGLAHKLINSLATARHYDSSVAKELLSSARQLFNLVPQQSRPKWLSTLIYRFNGKDLSPGTVASSDFVAFIVSTTYQFERPILSPEDIEFNFDLAFDEVRDSQRLPDTFDNLIAKLEEIIATDLIDSRVVQEALERLMALFKRNKHGSLASILVTMNFGRFALNAFGRSLAAVPVLKPLVEAFREEFSKAETKVHAAEETLKKEAVRRLTNQDRLIAYLEQSDTDISSIAGFLEVNEDGPSVAS